MGERDSKQITKELIRALKRGGLVGGARVATVDLGGSEEASVGRRYDRKGASHSKCRRRSFQAEGISRTRSPEEEQVWRVTGAEETSVAEQSEGRYWGTRRVQEGQEGPGHVQGVSQGKELGFYPEDSGRPREVDPSGLCFNPPPPHHMENDLCLHVQGGHLTLLHQCKQERTGPGWGW